MAKKGKTISSMSGFIYAVDFQTIPKNEVEIR
jgi:hypothetical protein